MDSLLPATELCFRVNDCFGLKVCWPVDEKHNMLLHATRALSLCFLAPSPR
jgi:hypothetical protein